MRTLLIILDFFFHLQRITLAHAILVWVIQHVNLCLLLILTSKRGGVLMALDGLSVSALHRCALSHVSPQGMR